MADMTGYPVLEWVSCKPLGTRGSECGKWLVIYCKQQQQRCVAGVALALRCLQTCETWQKSKTQNGQNQKVSIFFCGTLVSICFGGSYLILWTTVKVILVPNVLWNGVLSSVFCFVFCVRPRTARKWAPPNSEKK